jgi:hypothetical protein
MEKKVKQSLEDSELKAYVDELTLKWATIRSSEVPAVL